MISGIEASKFVVEELYADTWDEIERLTHAVERENDFATSGYMQERLDICYHDLHLYASLIKTFEGMVEAELNDMAEVMQETYDV